MSVDKQPLDIIPTQITADKLRLSTEYPQLTEWEAERLKAIGEALQAGKNLSETTKSEYLLLQQKATGITPVSPTLETSGST